VYNYLQVPEKVFAAVRSAMAKGIWFNRHIKGEYPFEEVTPGLKQTKLFGSSLTADRHPTPLKKR
jgi:hypothetical protein